MEAPENVGGITLFYVESIEKICDELKSEVKALKIELDVQSYWGPKWEEEHQKNLNLEAKNRELLARIEQYKIWQEESCSCKGE